MSSFEVIEGSLRSPTPPIAESKEKNRMPHFKVICGKNIKRYSVIAFIIPYLLFLVLLVSGHKQRRRRYTFHHTNKRCTCFQTLIGQLPFYLSDVCAR